MQDLVDLDFFTMLTVICKVLFVLLILAHARRRLVHFNVTEHPHRPVGSITIMSGRRLEMLTLYGVIIKRFFLRQTQGDSCDAIFC